MPSGLRDFQVSEQVRQADERVGVDGLRKLLSKRFEGNGRKAEPVAAPVAEPA